MSRVAVLREVLRSPPVRRVVLAYAVFELCEYATWIGILVHAYADGGATLAGLVATLQLVPAAVMALLAGHTAHRAAPARVLTCSYAVQATAAAAAAAALLLDAGSVAVYGSAIVLATFVSTVRPVQAAILPSVVRRTDELTACNVVASWVENGGLLVAGAVAGLALRFASVGVLLAGAAVLLAWAALLLARVPRVSVTAAAEDAGGPGVAARPDRHPVREVTRVWRRPPAGLLGALLGTDCIVLGALDVLFVVLAVDVLGAGQQWAGYLNTAFGAGALAGGLGAALLIGTRVGPVLAVAALVAGAALAGAAYGGLLVVVVLLAAAGGSHALFDVSARVLLQRSVPPDDAARLFGAVEALTMLGMAAGSLLVPALVSLGGPELAVLGTAVLLPLHVLLARRRLGRVDAQAHVPVVEMALLRRIPLFSMLPPASLEGIAQGVNRVAFAPGEVLVRQGDEGRAYYAIAEGTVRVEQDGRPIATVEQGGGLGEIALVRAVPRTATAVASSPVVALELDREPFLAAVTGHVSTLDRTLHVLDELEARDRLRRRDTDPEGDTPGASHPG